MKAPSFDLITFSVLLLTACLMAVVCGVFLPFAIATGNAISLNEITVAVPFAVSGFTGLMGVAAFGMAVNELTRK